MADLKLDILVLPTYNLLTLGVIDNSTYPEIVPSSPLLTVTVPGFDPIEIAFTMNTTNLYDSLDLGLSSEGDDLQILPDGIYTLKYSVVNVEILTYVEKSILRVDKLQEKFDNAFMQLDMMTCDGKLKKQAKVELTGIWFFIQSAIASANNCDVIGANALYKKADTLLDTFLKNDCGCSGNNFLINYF